MKNIQVIDGAMNATFSIFQAEDDDFSEIFLGLAKTSRSSRITLAASGKT